MTGASPVQLAGVRRATCAGARRRNRPQRRLLRCGAPPPTRRIRRAPGCAPVLDGPLERVQGRLASRNSASARRNSACAASPSMAGRTGGRSRSARTSRCDLDEGWRAHRRVGRRRTVAARGERRVGRHPVERAERFQQRPHGRRPAHRQPHRVGREHRAAFEQGGPDCGSECWWRGGDEPLQLVEVGAELLAARLGLGPEGGRVVEVAHRASPPFLERVDRLQRRCVRGLGVVQLVERARRRASACATGDRSKGTAAAARATSRARSTTGAPGSTPVVDSTTNSARAPSPASAPVKPVASAASSASSAPTTSARVTVPASMTVSRGWSSMESGARARSRGGRAASPQSCHAPSMQSACRPATWAVCTKRPFVRRVTPGQPTRARDSARASTTSSNARSVSLTSSADAGVGGESPGRRVRGRARCAHRRGRATAHRRSGSPPRRTAGRCARSSRSRGTTREPAGVDQDHGADGPVHEVVPHEAEAFLARRPEEVDDAASGRS